VQRQFRQGGTAENPEFVTQDDFDYDISTFQTKLGGIFTSAYKPTDNHKLFLRSFINRNSYDETQLASGFTNNLGPGFIQNQTRLRYTEEELTFAQLGGEHRFPWLNLDWRTAVARTTQNEPDTRHTTYNGPTEGPFIFTNDSSGGLRVFNALKERMTDSAVDFTIPFKTGLPFTEVWSDLAAKFKFGPAYTYRTHNFDQRRFRYAPDAGSFDLTRPPEEILAPENIGPGGVDFAETTVPTDVFEATQEVAAAYGMFDLPLVRDRLRLVAGVRTEYSLIRISSFDDIGDPVDIRKKNVDPLPGLNVIYTPREDMNLRFGYGESVSRPEFRELSPVQYPAPRGLRPLIGNPNLVQSSIVGYDLRWEWFFSPLEIVSVSLFHKKIDQPIEQVVVAQASNTADSFFNAEKATIKGIELEARKDWGFIWPRLKYLSLLTNFTYAKSEVMAPRTSNVQVQTETNRELQGQAPFIINAALDYTHPRWGSARLLYNSTDTRIAVAGSFGLPDIFEEQRDQVDFVALAPLKEYIGYPVTAKFSAENITNSPIVFTQGPEVQRRYTTGVKLTLSFSWAF
jgi:outer membrane receptor protein involved in Fe transport